jgi:oligoribonuclease NrnB/cAMP/cGMP phosphodiesterase (DHH superfamily)
MRIITRPDFDGVVCAALLGDALGIVGPVVWVEPNAVQKGRVAVGPEDILANLPYHPACALWFDHHYTNRHDHPFEGVFQIAPSAAGLVYGYYKDRFTRDFSQLVEATDRIDAAGLTEDEVLHPENHDHVLLSLTVPGSEEPDEPYWNHLVELLRTRPLAQLMEDPMVLERCRKVIANNVVYTDMLKQYTRVLAHVAVTDFRPLAKTPVGNRFLVYSLFPGTVVNVRIRYLDPDRRIIAVSVGHSIFNPHCRVNVGLMLAAFEGGGHRGAASCRFAAAKADEYIPKIIDILLKNDSNE